MVKQRDAGTQEITSDMQTKSDIETIRHARNCDLSIDIIEETIRYARHLNEYKHSSPSQPLPGSDFIHGMLTQEIITHELYEQLVRLAEDPDMNFEIIAE